MSYMFDCCGYTSMTNLDLGDKFDTSSVTDMSWMFYYCGYGAMTSLDLGDKFDTSSVTDMSWMFYYCGYGAMTSLDLGDKFDTSNATNMEYMFYKCGYTSMTSLDLGDKFDTSNVTNMNYMFADHNKLERIYVGRSFDTSSNPTSEHMFESNLKLVGGNGTRYDSNNITATYAWIDGTVDPSTGNPRPGYFWCHNEFDIIYNANAGSDIVTNMPTTQTKVFGTDLTLSSNVPVRTNYIFKGWSLSSGTNNTVQYSAGGTYTQNAGATLYAVWMPASAQYLPGREFNQAIKRLAGNSSATYSTSDTKIKAIEFSAVAPAQSVTTSNVGVTTGAPIYAWFEEDTVANDGTGTIKLWSSANAISMNKSALNLFSGLRQLETINPLTDLGITEGTGNVTNMSYMFYETGYDANQFTPIGLSNWDVSNVNDMSWMFQNSGYNASVWNIGDLSSWDVSSVTSIRGMFKRSGISATTYRMNLAGWKLTGTDSLTEFLDGAGDSATDWTIGDLSGWDVSTIKYMYWTFRCGAHATNWSIGDISGWNTSSVEDFGYTFGGAGQYSSTFVLNVGPWDVSKAKKMSKMFNEAGRDATTWSIGDLSNWNTSNVDEMGGMFESAGTNTPNFYIGDLSNWDTSKVLHMNSMFYKTGYNSSTYTLNLTGWDTSKVTDMTSMFEYCRNIKHIYASSSFVTTQVTDSTNMFNGCTSLDGGSGTQYTEANPKDKTYARLDGENGLPGYFYNVSTYNVDYNANTTDAVTNMPASQTKTYGVDLTLSSNVPVRTNYVFKGWSLNSGTSNTVQYSAGDTYTQNAGATLYAVWKPAEAQYLPGNQFNLKVKRLVDESVPNSTTIDTTITAFEYQTGNMTIDDVPNSAVIVSVATKTPIYAWLDGTIIKLWSEAEDIKLNDDVTDMFEGFGAISTFALISDLGITENNANITSTSSMFSYFGNNLTRFDLSGFDTSNVTDMSYMFRVFDSSATDLNLDLSGLDTSSVTNMKYMFSRIGNNSNSVNLDLSGWDTSRVTNMTYMFHQTAEYSNSFELDISGWDTSSVTNMSNMFQNAGARSTSFNIDLSNLDTSSVTDMSSMFYCAGQDSSSMWNIGDISNWNTSNVTSMRGMFDYAGRNASTWNVGTLSGWDVSNVTNMSSMFDNAGNKAQSFVLDLSSWDTQSVTDMSFMFNRAGASANVWSIGDISNWNTASVTNMKAMFESTGGKLPTFNLDLSSWDVSNVTNMEYMFQFISNSSNTDSVNINLSGWDVSNVTTMHEMFYGTGYSAKSLKLDLSDWNIEKVTTMENIFEATGYDSTSIEIKGLQTWDVSSVNNMYGMFSSCGRKASKVNIDLTSWDTSGATNMEFMFNEFGYNATDWSIGDLSNWNVSNVTNMNGMFYRAGYNASAWNIGDLSNWNVSNVTNMSTMFSYSGYNSSTYSLNLAGWNTSKVTNMTRMFEQCRKILHLYASSSFVTTQVTDSTNMFRGCTSLDGGSGTQYTEANPKDKTYARLDGENGLSGYFYNIATYNVDYDTNTTDAVTNMPGSQTKTYGIELTLSNNIPVRSGYIFKGWSLASGTNNTVQYNAGGSYTQNSQATLYAVWEILDVSGITATKYGTGQIRINGLPADVTARIWVPERFVADKQRNPIYCSKYTENIVVDASHNTSQNSVSTGTAMPSTIKDVYMQLLDENGNVISDLYYCDLSSVTTSGFREVTTEDYAGDLYVSNVSLKSRSSGTVVRKTNHANANPVPTLNDRIIDFDLSFKLNRDATEYSAKYNVTIVNDTAQDFEFNTPNYAPRVWCNGNSQDVTSMNYVNWNITSLYPGDIIRAGESQLAVVEFTFGGDNKPSDNAFNRQWTYDIDTTGGMNIIENAIVDTVSRISAVVNESTGDLRGSITRTPFVVEVTNEFEVAKTFELSILEDTKFRITNSAGNSPIYTIAGKTAGGDPVVQNYTFYIEEIPDEVFASSPQKITVLFKPTDAENAINVGKVYAQVDIDDTVVDEEPPMISDVVIEEVAEENVNNPVRKVKVSWDSVDDSSVEEYTVVLTQQGGATSTYTTTSDPSNGKYDADTYIYIDGLTEDATYTATVYGKDSNQNKPGSELINSATTSQGYACKSESKKVEWEYTVTVSTSNCTSNPSATTQTAYRGHDFVISFTRTNDYTYQNPTVTVSGTEITANVDTNDTNRTVTIRSANITGPITITQTAYRNLCLAVGTPILLANGNYKNIEDIEYTDLLRVYNHVTGEMTDVYPIWIENGTLANDYDVVTFSDGTELKVVGGHYVFSVDKNRYVNVSNENECPVGTRVYKVVDDKLTIVKVVKVEHFEDEIKYYNVVSSVHYNLIANGLLTTDPTSSISNVYGFKENALYGDRYYEISADEVGLPYEYVSSIPYYLYKGLNLRNAKVLIGNELDMSFLEDFVSRKTKEIPSKDGKLLFKVTTSLDDYNNDYMYEQGGEYTLPKVGATKFVETSTGRVFNPGDTVTVDYSMHFEAIK